MTATTAILDHVPAAMLVMFRIGGMMMHGPVFGSSVVPTRLKLFLTLTVGLAAYPLLSSVHFQNMDLELSFWSLAPLACMELLIGFVIGFIASLPMVSMQTGGLIMGQQMGLGFAQLYNPAIDDEADVIGQMLFFMALAGFLLAGGHEWMLLAILHSFEHVPVGRFTMDGDLLMLIAGLLTASLELALRVAAPLLALIFLETAAMGLLAKTVPQLNILSLGFPLRILMGMAIVAFGLVVIHDVAMAEIASVFSALFEWLNGWDAPSAGELHGR